MSDENSDPKMNLDKKQSSDNNESNNEVEAFSQYVNKSFLPKNEEFDAIVLKHFDKQIEVFRNYMFNKYKISIDDNDPICAEYLMIRQFAALIVPLSKNCQELRNVINLVQTDLNTVSVNNHKQTLHTTDMAVAQITKMLVNLGNNLIEKHNATNQEFIDKVSKFTGVESNSAIICNIWIATIALAMIMLTMGLLVIKYL